jgi:aspartyl-tRNA(Asn)/glutamyl-tRNA(Gln) amidotransferase subunit B
MWTTGRSAGTIIEDESLAQVADTDALTAIVAEVVAEHAGVVAQFRAGKSNAFGFLVGKAMKASGGKANPKVISDLLRATLERT